MSHQATSPSNDDSSSSSLDDDNDEDIPDDGLCEYERQRLERIARNNARLAMLGFNDNQEKRKKNKRKIAPRSIAPDGPRMRRNPVRSSRDTTSEGGKKQVNAHAVQTFTDSSSLEGLKM